MKRVLIPFLIILSFMAGCRSEVPSVVGRLQVQKSQYPQLIASLDSALAPRGLRKQGAPGLNELKDREVLFLAYAQPRTGRRPLVITDVKQEGVVEFQIYRQDFDTQRDYDDFVSSVFGVFKASGKVTVDRRE